MYIYITNTYNTFILDQLIECFLMTYNFTISHQTKCNLIKLNHYYYYFRNIFISLFNTLAVIDKYLDKVSKQIHNWHTSDEQQF